MLSVGLLSLSAILAVKLIPKFIALSVSMSESLYLFALEVISTKSLSAGFIALGASASVAQIAIGSLVAVVAIGVMVFSKYKAVQEDLKNSAIELSEAYDKEKESYSALEEQLLSEALTRRELDDIVSSNLDSYSDEIDKIDDLNIARERAIELLKEQKLESAEDFTEKGLTQYEKFLDKSANIYGVNLNVDEAETIINGLKIKIKELAETENRNVIEDLMLSNYTKELSEIEASLDEAIPYIDKFNNSLKLQGLVYDENTGSIRDMTEAELNLYNIQQGIADGSINVEDTISRQMKMQNETTSATLDNIALLDEVIESLDTKLSTLSSTTLSGLGDAFNLVTDAMKEMYTVEGMSVDTYDALLSLGADYVSVLLDEEGSLRSTADAENALYYAKIDEMAISTSLNLIKKATEMANDDVAGSYSDLASNIDSYVESEWSAVEVALMSAEISDKDTTVVRKQIETIQAWATQAKSNIGVYKATAKAVSSTTDAVEEATDAMIEQYKSAFGYVEDQIDKYIDKLEEKRDIELSVIDAQLDALNKQNDALQDQIDKEEALKNIAEAKEKKVYVLTNGRFQYVEDVEAVSSAQEEYNTLIKEQQYEKQVSDLEDYRDDVENEYDKQIQVYEDYKNSFSDMVDSYETEQSRLLASELLGINTESDMWVKNLTDFSSYINSYNALLAKKGNSSTNNTSNYTPVDDTPIVNSVSHVSSSAGMPTNIPSQYQVSYIPSTSSRTGMVASKAGMPSNIGVPKEYSGHGGTSGSFASGNSSIDKDGIYRTGENPNTELIIGSRVNGNISRLDKGTGIVNAKSTNTFAGLINSINSNSINGKTGEMSNDSSTNISNNDGINIYGAISVIANNIDEFEQSIKTKFRTNMIQKAYENK